MRRSLAAVLMISGPILGPVGVSSAWAGNAAELKIYSPALTYGERELEYRSFLSHPGQEQGYAFSFGYGFTSYWASEVYEVLHKDPQEALVGDAVEWENLFQWTPQGRFWADAGLLIETEIPQQKGSQGDVRVSPLLEKQIGPAVFTLNLPLEWQFGPQFTSGTGLSYAARAEYWLVPAFSPAVEAFGEPGVIGNFPSVREQNHSLGPAFYGSWRLGGRRKIKYSAASLFGWTPASPDWTFIARLEFEF